MNRYLCTTLLLLTIPVCTHAEDNPGVPTAAERAADEQKVSDEEAQARRNSPVVVYDKRGVPVKSSEAKKDAGTPGRDLNAKGFSLRTPAGGDSGGSTAGAAPVKGGGASSVTPTRPGVNPADISAGAPPAGLDKSKDGACQSGGYRENAKTHGIEYARIKCQSQQLKDNKALKIAPLAPLMPPWELKKQMDKMKD